MSSSYIVHVSNIASITSKDHLHDFFTFCGKITSIDYNETTHSAEVQFEKASAAKTALMLNGGVLDGSQITVTSPSDHPDHTNVAEDEHALPDQADKPRAGIAAEYLAKGYLLSDHILQRAIEIDQRQGISQRFLNYIQSLDTKVGERALGKEKTVSGKVQETLVQATARAKEIDEQKGVSVKAWDYYTRALSSPFGQKVKNFYTHTSKQVYDIHEEARRIAEQHKQAAGTPTSTDANAHSSTAPLPSGAEDKPKATEAPTLS